MAGDPVVGKTLSQNLQTLKEALETSEPTGQSNLLFEQFREIVGCCQKLSSTSNALLPPCLTELADILLTTLAAGPKDNAGVALDTALLGASAFTSVLSLIAEPTSVALMFSKTFIPTIGNSDASPALKIRLSKTGSDLSLAVDDPPSFRLTLCYALLQAPNSFWNCTQINWSSLLVSRMFPLFEKHCFECNYLTLLSFKCIALWASRVMKTLGRVPPDIVIRIFNIIMTNWESSYNGVREQNSLLFEHLLNLTDASEDTPADIVPILLRPSSILQQLVLTEMSWMMKAKYFMLAVILPKVGVHKILMRHSEDIVSGLLTSLSYSHLAPAGADLYKICINSISLDQWEQFFLQPIINVLTTSKYLLQKQNVFSYWMAHTLKKYKISLQLVLDGLLECSDSQDNLLPIILCLKLGRKEGHDAMNWSTIGQSGHLARSLRHSNELIRANGFAVVCVSCKTSACPSDEEFTLVEMYLNENVNADSTPLRHNMIVNFTTFLCRLRDACLQALKTAKLQHQSTQFENRTLARSMAFLDWLYNWLRSNLEVGSNYQRRMTSLELYKTVLAYLSDCPQTNNTGQRKSNSKNEGNRVMKYAITVGKWGFTSEVGREAILFCISDTNKDVRELACYILTKYFKMNDSESLRFKELYERGVSLCCDSMFYRAEIGATLIHAVCTLKRNGPVSSLELLSLAEEHAEQLKHDYLKAITGGAPLYGILEALIRLYSDQDGPEYRLLSALELHRLILLLESVTKHLLQILSSKATSSDGAPSFEEMDLAIGLILEETSVNVEESTGSNQSSAQQLALNNIWLNLKACCKAASEIGKSPDGDSERCLLIITSVLLQCRHKGAIEAAGSALAALAVEMSVGSQRFCLENVLNEALQSLELGETQSTRGAGTVILIHRLVAHDSAPNRPLVLKCLMHLIEMVENNKGDVPKALHVISVIMKDASLSQVTSSLIYRVTAIAFTSLSQPSWAIRNSGLQLFGVLVPKIIGQRKRYADDATCSCYHLPYEELYYNARPLMNFLLDELDERMKDDSPKAHSQLVPLLTLLSNLSVGLLTIVDRGNFETIVQKFVNCFQSLMSSKIYKIRELAARADTWFCSQSQLPVFFRTRVWKIVDFIKDRNADNEIKSENALHGFLLSIKYLYDRFREERSGVSILREQQYVIDEAIHELRSVDESTNLSYECKCVLSNVLGIDTFIPASKQVKRLNILPNSQIHKILGFPSWMAVKATHLITDCTLNELLPSLSSALDSGIPELQICSINALFSRIAKVEFEAVSNGALTILFKYITLNICEEALTLILEILLRYPASTNNLNVTGLLKTLSTEDSPLCVAISCKLLILESDPEQWLLYATVNRLKTLAQPNEDEYSRLISAKGLVLIAPLMMKAATEDSFEPRLIIWKTAVTLLQDENQNVRVQASAFTNHLVEKSQVDVLNPYISLHFLFQEQTLVNIFPIRYRVKCLWEKLRCTDDEINSIDIYNPARNPFERSIINIYEENLRIVDICAERLLSLLQQDISARKYFLNDEVLPQLSLLRLHSQKLLSFSQENSYSCSNNNFVTSSWYSVAKKLSAQFKLIEFVNNNTLDEELNMFQYRFHSYLEQTTPIPS
ncbi:hypothetical protein O3M35_000305 [Rhynocoris fuscipes]|uniref:DUF2428 domain-containing protein n=1 Tax=Rhynocoris fuscipes TaxID=488301 RepID=A0AAW1DLX5_9HEMI